MRGNVPPSNGTPGRCSTPSARSNTAWLPGPACDGAARACALQQKRPPRHTAWLRYREGESDLPDVLQLHQRLLEIEQSLYRVELLQLSERINLHLALGGDFAAYEK